MQAITTIGLDIAKSVFQVHGVDAEGQCHPSPSAQAALRAGILPEAAAVPGWYRGLRFVIIGRASCGRSATLCA